MSDPGQPGRQWPWQAARRRVERRRAEYARLVEVVARHHPDYRENREALASLQASIAADQIESSERTGRTLTFATWALVLVTLALVVTTIVLTVVTARQ